MTDGTIKGTGNSRYLKSVANFLELYPNFEAFAQALISGTLPIDLNGINTAGWSQIGTPLNKASLLSDGTATNTGLTSAATPDQALNKLDSRLDAVETKANTILPKSGGAMTGTLSNDASAQVRNIQYSTTDLTAGSSNLTTGAVYLVYE